MREHALHRGALGDDGEHAKSSVTLRARDPNCSRDANGCGAAK
jgi:hypothetical protein